MVNQKNIRGREVKKRLFILFRHIFKSMHFYRTDKKVHFSRRVFTDAQGISFWFNHLIKELFLKYYQKDDSAAFVLLYAQEALTHFYSNLPYKMGQDFLEIHYAEKLWYKRNTLLLFMVGIFFTEWELYSRNLWATSRQESCCRHVIVR